MEKIQASVINEFTCPKCGCYPPDTDGDPYVVIEDKSYPIYKNEHAYYTDYGIGHGWTETHYCTECELEFEFLNGDM